MTKSQKRARNPRILRWVGEESCKQIWFLCKLPSYEKFSKLILLIRLRDFLKGLNKSFKQKKEKKTTF
jgi:hypothetical protein